MPTTKDLLNNSTVVAFIPAEALAVDTETGGITDLQGKGRKILMAINAGTPAAGGLANIIVQESNAPTFAIAGTETLDAAVSLTDVYVDIQPGEGANLPLYDFNILIDAEIMTVTERITDRLYVKRGQQGTTTAIHADDTAVTLQIDTLHTFAEIDAAGLVEADLAPNKRYVRVVAAVTVDVFTLGVTGIIYLEREVPSGI